jgi:uncharacterized protein YjbI with pentapeptide repeats
VLSPVTGDSLLLEDEVRDHLARTHGDKLRLVGPAGSGKTTALEHLAHVFSGKSLYLLDDPPTEHLCLLKPGQHHCAVQASADLAAVPGTMAYRLAPWREDEWIEYLLAVHREHCGSVMIRLQADPGHSLLAGNPELWRIVLDQMAAQPALTSVRAALLSHLAGQLAVPAKRSYIQKTSTALLLAAEGQAESLSAVKQQEGEAVFRLLRHRPLQLLLAGAQVVIDIRRKSDQQYFGRHFPRDLVEEVAAAALATPEVFDALRGWFHKRNERQALAASVLHAGRTGWVPAAGTRPHLAGAYLAGVSWPGVDLVDVELYSADLRRANLQKANLENVRATGADFRHADLRGAWLRGATATRAKLANADLASSKGPGGHFEEADLEAANLDDARFPKGSFTGANLRGASLHSAFLQEADFKEAKLEGADFAEANLEGANLAGLSLRQARLTRAVFARANLKGCDLEEVELPNANFAGANLESALLTASTLPGANFEGARLVDAGLADIDWEGACLRGADLRRASFHLGSSRSGRVESPTACEGSRTGYYTDDFSEQDFKAPEEIRKANLCYADLRDARIDGVDFYLVDLRHAQYDTEQEKHLRRCGAILRDRSESA